MPKFTHVDLASGHALPRAAGCPSCGGLEIKLVLKQCTPARAALAELKQAAELIPNQGMLNTLPVLEAQASSEVENIVTTTDRLFQFQNIGGCADPATRKALRHAAVLGETPPLGVPTCRQSAT